MIFGAGRFRVLIFILCHVVFCIHFLKRAGRTRLLVPPFSHYESFSSLVIKSAASTASPEKFPAMIHLTAREASLMAPKWLPNFG